MNPIPRWGWFPILKSLQSLGRVLSGEREWQWQWQWQWADESGTPPLQTRTSSLPTRAISTIGFLLAILTLNGLWPPPAVNAHPFHTSLAEAEWNREKSQLEIALRVDANDLEQALRKRSGATLVLENATAERSLEGYVRQIWHVRGADGTEAVLSWVGYEVEGPHAWLYFAVPLPMGWTGATVTHRLLLEENAEQSNLLVVREAVRGTRCSLRFHREQPTQRLTVQQPVAPPKP